MSRPAQTLVVGVLVVLAAVTSAGVVLAVDGATNQSAPDAQPSQENRTITVSATGEAKARPDTATVRLAVVARDESITDARTAVAENVSSVIETLSSANVSEDQIRTVDYRIQKERPDTYAEKTDERTVYVARHVLEVSLNDTDRVGAVIDAAVDAGAARVADVRFSLSTETRTALRQEALTEAMTAARGEATTIAESASVTITGISSVQSTDGGFPGPIYLTETTAQSGGSTDIVTGPVTVKASVTVTYLASE